MKSWTLRLLRLAQNLLAFLLLLSAAVATLVWMRFVPQMTAGYVISGMLFLALLAGLFVTARRSNSDWRFVLKLTCVFAAAKFLLIFAVRNYEQTGDCWLFATSLRYFCNHGFGDASLRDLFRADYDAHIWIVRAFPFSYPLARVFPNAIVLVGQLSNVAMCAAQNLLAFWLFRRWLSARAACFSFILLTVLPLHTWQALDFTHQFQGAFFVICSLVALTLIAEKARAGAVGWGGAIVLGVLLFVLRVQGGMDLFMLLACVLLTAIAFALEEDRAVVRRLAISLFIGVVVIYLPASRMLSKWTSRFDDLNLNSHPASFVARGWTLPMWGEYYARYEQIDRMTPLAQKRPTMTGLVVSQMAYEPVRTLIELPWAKFAKFFLVGFAANHETGLRESGYSWLEPAARASRHVFAPVFLLLSVIGCWRWPRRAGNCMLRWLAGLLPLLFAGVYLVFGETSPRYSFHVHFALAMLAGVGLEVVVARLSQRGADEGKIVRLADVTGSAGAAIGLTLVLVVASLMLPPVLKKAAGKFFLCDMRQSKILVPENAAYSGETVFDSVVPVFSPTPDGGVIASAELSVVPRHDDRYVSCFFWPCCSEKLSQNLWVEFSLDGKVLLREPLNTLYPARFVELPLNSGDGIRKLRVGLRSSQTGTWRLGEPAFRWGYVRTY